MKIVGVMSGTSLDGLDFVLTQISDDENAIKYKILKAETYPYPPSLKTELAQAHLKSGYELIELHKKYGKYIGENIKKFLGQDDADYIASHGHTVFHQPENQMTFQIGDGAFIAANANISTVSDFRNLDTAFGGQGAPLVPLGDKLLFNQYVACINIGGFVNISFDKNNRRQAFDICPGNRIPNKLARQKNLDFDDEGRLGRAGKVDKNLLNILNDIEYYKLPYPKSLAREWEETVFVPIINNFKNLSINDRLATIYEHIAECIERVASTIKIGDILITGGGAYNKYLIERIQAKLKHKIVIPDDALIQYKEALIFALLGFLRVTEKQNIVSSYTGALQNTSSGIIHIV